MKESNTEDEMTKKRFDSVASLVRGEDESDTSRDVPDSVKLKLYGYYKVATDKSFHNQASPSYFSVVARAKYNAWKDAVAECTNAEDAMKAYIELAELWLGKLERLDEMNELSTVSEIEKKPVQSKKSFLPQPVIARGTLDISYRDLFYALKCCILPNMIMHGERGCESSIMDIYQTRIEQEWIKKCQKIESKESFASVVVGLSVRSLLDLYLTVKSYPANSEIIIVPPLNIKGIIDIITCTHNLKVIPIDLPDKNLIGIDLNRVEEAITTKTVAIMIVHPFGKMAITTSNMKYLSQTICKKYNLDLLEDCAECFSPYHNSDMQQPADTNEYASVSFYSFGFIKTATSLGGAIAYFPSQKNDIPAQMKDLQNLRRLSQTQNNLHFLSKVIKAFLLKFFSDTPYLVGITALLCQLLGNDYGEFVTSLIKAFPDDQHQSSKEQHNSRMKKVRQTPSLALLALLYRRLQYYKFNMIESRIKRCEDVVHLMKNNGLLESGRVQLPHNNLSNLFWLFPILVDKPDEVTRVMMEHGFDVPQGTSQLGCIDSFLKDNEDCCPYAKEMMNKVLYLPIASKKDIPLERMVTALDLATNKKIPKKIDRFFPRWLAFFTIVIFSMKGCLFPTLPYIGLLGCIILMLIILLRWKLSPLYLSSKTFANYNSISSERAKYNENVFKSLNLFEIKTPKTQSAMALVTGSTGFIGTLLIRNLLLHRNDLNIPGGIILLCRSKKNMSAKERIHKHIMKNSLFHFLSQAEFDKYVHVIEGNVNHPNLGMDEATLKRLSRYNVTHVFHAAASVSFIQPLADAAESNITSALQVQSLAKNGFQRPAKYIHFSTAFVHGNCINNTVTEELFDFHKYDPHKLYESIMGTQSLAWDAYNHFQFPNTYTFTKSICEHLILQNDNHTIIVRPSIVGPSILFPFEGWCGQKPSTLVGAGCLYLKYQWSLWCFKKTQVPVVPVDVVVQFTIKKAFHETHLCSSTEDVCARSDSSDEDALLIDAKKQIYNIAWDLKSPASHSFHWFDFASCLTQTGRVHGYFGSLTACITLNFAQRIQLSKEQFEFYHRILVRKPFSFALWIVQNIGLKDTTIRLRRFSKLLDVPLLFYHFSTGEFKFQSELIAPSEFNGERYMMNCILAAEDFISNKKSSTKIIAGKNHSTVNSDFWWALTQPQGNLFIRIAGFVLIKILRYTTNELTVDLGSFCPLALSHKNSKPHIILAPTHRSLFDFLVLSFIFFAIPEISIPIPFIAAADDFKYIPFFGWFAKGAQAFFLQRGAGKEDPELKKKIYQLKTSAGHDGTVIEVFVEGKRSRDRRFNPAKSGLLRCLANTGGDHVIVPITINYERIPEQATLAGETKDSKRKSLGLHELFSWLLDVYHNRVNLGRIHVQASCPVPLSLNEGNAKSVARIVQQHQKESIVVSDYHIDAGAKLLNLPSQNIKNALDFLGCTFWHSTELSPRIFSEPVELPESKTELWSIMLQYGHIFAPCLFESHPQWSTWLDPTLLNTDINKQKKKDNLINEDVGIVLKIMIESFEEAETAVNKTIIFLASKGFLCPNHSHIYQYTKNQHEHIASILLSAAVNIYLISQTGKSEVDMTSLTSAKSSSNSLSIPTVKPLYKNGGRKDSHAGHKSSEIESFGAWGYLDSGFILNIDNSGKRSVVMKGCRYDFCGRKMPRIIHFLEREMGVAVNPCNTAFDLGHELDDISLPNCQIDNEGLMKILALIHNDKERMSTSSVDRVRHGTGHTQEDMYRIRSKSFENFRVPDVVVWPIDENEVTDLVQNASIYNWCLIPFGGGTNVTHSTWCPSIEEEARPIISVDMKLMNKVLWVNEGDGIAHVQAGITGRRLVCEMEKLGFTIGHEPDSIEFSTLGGWVATKASGMKQNKYGNIEDIVVNVCVAGAQGLMWQHKDKVNSNDKIFSAFDRVSTGIDLKSLITGSEGCLGIITSVAIKVWPISERKEYDSVILSHFERGIEFVRDISKLRAFKPASVRLVDNEQFQMAQALSEERHGFEKMKDITLKMASAILHNFSSSSVVAVTIAYEGSHDEVDFQKSLIRKLVKKHGAVLAGPKVGKSGYDLTFAIAYLRDFAMTYFFLAESFETFVPWTCVNRLVMKTKQRIRDEFGLRCLPGRPMISARVTQLYDNGVCVYFYFCMNFEHVQNASAVYSEIEHAAREEILKEGGSLSHHHGIGKHRLSFMKDVNSCHFQKTLMNLKKAVDPNNIFGGRNGSFGVLE